MPCLALFADVVGILGGLTVGVLWLDLPVVVYLRQTRLDRREGENAGQWHFSIGYTF